MSTKQDSFLKWKDLQAFLKQNQTLAFSQKTMFVGFLIVLAFLSHFIFITQPPLLKKIPGLSSLHKTPFLKTLQTVEGPLIEHDLDVRVLKIQRGNKIYLDFLSQKPDKSYLIINSLPLRGGREAYYYHPLGKEQMASLLIEDADGDGRMDLIAPTFDNFFRYHKNIVIYNPQTKQFELQNSN